VFTGLGTFTLRSLSLTSLHGLGQHSEVSRMYMQNNLLTSFEGWETQPNLEELHAEDNMIENFRGMRPQPRLEAVFLGGNPVRSLYCYRVMALAATGASLKTIDGEPVKRAELDKARALPPEVVEAVRDGWALDTVPNPDADYDMSLEEFRAFRRNSANFAPHLPASSSDEEVQYAPRRASRGGPHRSPHPRQASQVTASERRGNHKMVL